MKKKSKYYLLLFMFITPLSFTLPTNKSRKKTLLSNAYDSFEPSDYLKRIPQKSSSSNYFEYFVTFIASLFIKKTRAYKVEDIMINKKATLLRTVYEKYKNKDELQEKDIFDLYKLLTEKELYVFNYTKLSDLLNNQLTSLNDTINSALDSFDITYQDSTYSLKKILQSYKNVIDSLNAQIKTNDKIEAIFSKAEAETESKDSILLFEMAFMKEYRKSDPKAYRNYAPQQKREIIVHEELI